MSRVALETLTKDEQYKHDCHKAEDLIHSKHYSFHLQVQVQVQDIVAELNRFLVHEYPRTTCIISSVVLHARADGLYEMGFVFTERKGVHDSALVEKIRRIGNDRSIFPEYNFYEREMLAQRQQELINYKLAEIKLRLLESQQAENI
jgi:hypothetical protein